MPPCCGDLLHGEADAPEIEAVARALGVRRQDVGREDLERRVPLLYRLGNLVEDAKRQRARERDVEGVVHVRLPLPARGALLEHGLDLAPRPHVAEVDVSRGAAAGHAPRVVLGAERERRRLRMRHDAVREVGVGLDAPRRDDEAGGVYDARSFTGQRAGGAQHRDAPVLHAHVPGAYALGRNDTSAADHEVEHAPSLAQAAGAVK